MHVLNHPLLVPPSTPTLLTIIESLNHARIRTGPRKHEIILECALAPVGLHLPDLAVLTP